MVLYKPNPRHPRVIAKNNLRLYLVLKAYNSFLSVTFETMAIINRNIKVAGA